MNDVRTGTGGRPPSGGTSSGLGGATWAYLALAVLGAVGTWFFNLRFTGGPDGENYLEAWFANPASSSAAVDVIVTALVACVFYVREGRRLRMRFAWLLVPLTFVVALAFTLPLFLAWREVVLRRGHLTAAATSR